MTSKHLIILFVIVVATRLPFLWIGYGSDADAWMVARSASLLWETGTYEPSRLPGYPLHEILSAPFVGIGKAPLSNAATLLACLLLILTWKRLTVSRSTHSFLLIIAMAFAPLVWKNSSTTMDYLWALLAIVLSTQCALDKKHFSSGIWLGVAAGFRPINILAVLPIFTLLLLERISLRNAFVFLGAAIATAATAFLPPLLKYGFLGWVSSTIIATSDIALTFTDRLLQFGYRSVTSVGIPTVIAALAIGIFRRKKLISEIRNNDPIVISSVCGLFTFLGLYWCFPLEREYLLPVLPFALLLFDKIAPRRDMLFLVVYLLSFAFVNPDVIRHHGFKGTPGFNIHQGIILEEFGKREYILSLREDIARFTLKGKSLVMTGGDRELWHENPALEVDTTDFWTSFGETVVFQKRNRDTRFIRVLTRDELRRAREAGCVVYCGDWIQEYVERISGYAMQEEGIPIVSLSDGK